MDVEEAGTPATYKYQSCDSIFRYDSKKYFIFHKNRIPLLRSKNKILRNSHETDKKWPILTFGRDTLQQSRLCQTFRQECVRRLISPSHTTSLPTGPLCVCFLLRKRQLPTRALDKQAVAFPCVSSCSSKSEIEVVIALGACISEKRDEQRYHELLVAVEHCIIPFSLACRASAVLCGNY